MNKSSGKKQLAVAVLAATGGSVLGGPAYAQGLEEVVVTAQKRAVNLQSTGVAVTALTAESMAAAGINDMVDLETRVPGMSMGTFNLGQPQIYIRGIGSNADGASADNSVVVFLDEVYIGRAAGSALNLYDVERVEVLRGPQGTLYGKNVVGGAINVISRKPTEDFYTRGEVTAGNWDRQVAKAAVSGPLSDKLFAKVAGSSARHDGYMESRNPAAYGKALNDMDALNMRGQLRYLPLDTLELNFSVDWAKDRNAGRGRISTPGTVVYDALKARAPEVADNDELSYSDNPGFQNRDVTGYMFRADWDIPLGTVTAITGYRETAFEMYDDGMNIDPSLIGLDGGTYVDEDAEQFSQEIRITSEGYAPWNWIAGVYYLKEDIFRDETAISQQGSLSIPTVNLQWNTTESYAVFGEVSYDFTDRLKLAVGGRYTTETKDARQARQDAIDPGTNFDVSPDADWNAFTPRAVLDYQATDDVFLYGSVSKGFKSGGFAGTSETPEAASTPFDQETALTYEVGMKSEWLDNSLRFNVAAFYTSYDDLQVLEYIVIDPVLLEGYFLTDNAASATSQGVEIEWQYRPTILPGLELSGTYAWMEATYDEYEPDASANGANLRNAPEQSYNIAVSYDYDLGSGGYFNARYEYRYKDETFQDPQNYALSSIPDYATSNARLSYTPASEKWTLSAWVDNITDEDYLIHNFPIAITDTGGIAAPATPGHPRTYGMTLGWDF